MPKVLESILLSIKKLNNVAEDDTAFDNDFILQINSALSDLNQMGIGAVEGFAIEDKNDLWEDFLGDDKRLNSVKTLIGLKTRLYFDPPQNSFGIGMMERQIEEQSWRLRVAQEDIDEEEEVG